MPVGTAAQLEPPSVERSTTDPAMRQRIDGLGDAIWFAAVIVPTRPLADRAKGCLRLLRLQSIAAILQVAAFLAAGWLMV